MNDKIIRQALYFDLDTKELQKYFKDISKAYYIIEREFKEANFEHRQG